MRIITQKEILQDELISILTVDEAKELYRTLPALKQKHSHINDVEIKNVNDNYSRLFQKTLDSGERNIMTICEKEQTRYTSFQFVYDKDALYILVNEVPVLKSTGKIHEALKCKESNNQVCYIGLLPYDEVTRNYIEKYKVINYNNKELNYGDDKFRCSNKKHIQFITDEFYKHCEKMYPNSTTELVGVLETYPTPNVKNTIGAKDAALYDVKFPHFKDAKSFVEILRIDEAELIIGKKGVLQLFVNPKLFVNHNPSYGPIGLGGLKWHDEKYYTWHFTPQKRVKKMKKIEASLQKVLEVREELGSEMVLPFAIKRKKRPSQRLFMGNLREGESLEGAKAMSSFIEPNDSIRVIYQEHYNFVESYKSLNEYYQYNIEDVLEEFEDTLDEDENTVIYFSDIFTSNYFCGDAFKNKENVRFLLSIDSEKTYIRKNNKYLCALDIAGGGSLTFAIDEAIFNDDEIVKVTQFYSDC